MVPPTANIINDSDNEKKKIFINSLAKRDGKLVSPIDLNLDIAQPIILEKLKWMVFDEAPIRMKVTNSGETVIVSAKWGKLRPFIIGGPLDGNYVFSQIHFHWGSDEHQGSEHTVKGVSYPMEMHVVFFKTQYISQEAALKHDDGLVVVVYLMKLQKKSARGLQWLTSQLGKVIEPEKSAVLPLSPLSSLLVPFTRDYIMYWGTLNTWRCSHTMLWLVSRAALSINVDDLNMFRRLLNSRKEPMNKNFRETSPSQGRYIFHVNPSTDTTNLLLPGCIDPPGESLIVNFSQMPTLDQSQAEQIFCRGDATDDGSDKMSTDTIRGTKLNKTLSNSRTYVFCEGLNRGTEERANKLIKKSSKTESNSSSKESCSFKSIAITSRPIVSHMKKINDELLRMKSQKKRHVNLRKNLEKERRLEMEKKKNKIQKKNEDESHQTINDLKKYMHSSNHRSLTTRSVHPYTMPRRNKLRLKEESIVQVRKEDKKEEDNRSIEICVHLPPCEKSNQTIEETSATRIKYEVVNNEEVTEANEDEQEKETSTKYENSQFKSKLPVRMTGNKPVLQSSLARYFTNDRPDSAPQPKSPRRKVMEENVRLSSDQRLITTIPRPIGKNAGKLDGSGKMPNMTH